MVLFVLDELRLGPFVIDGRIEDVVLNDGRRIWVEFPEDMELDCDWKV